MHLERLELFGFKSFAERGRLDFLPPSATSQGITAVVGPNGSGKSNVADAIRWVLGEQSLKLLRGKKAEDVIFSGSEKRGRSGFAEVTLHLNNEDGKIPVDYSQVTISRRVYRDGESEYLINKNKVRLADINLMLAQAQIGSKSYAVIGQGMADGILTASPEERKEFFDEAAGVRQFQIKRNQAENRLATAKENLSQANLLVSEIEPRLRSLSRQVERLNTRKTLEEDLHAAKHQYYSQLWRTIQTELNQKNQAFTQAEKHWQEQEATIREAKEALEKLRSNPEGKGEDSGWNELQKRYETLIEERSKMQSQQFQLQGKIEVAREVRRQVSTPLPLSKIIEEIGGMKTVQGSAITALKEAQNLEAAHATVPHFTRVHETTLSLSERLERPAVETSSAPAADPALLAELEQIKAAVAKLHQEVTDAQNNLHSHSRKERENKAQFFALQQQLEERLNAAHNTERRVSDTRVEVARVETRRDTLAKEMSLELGENAQRVQSQPAAETTEPTEFLQSKMQKLRYQLELIGGIDPETIREYEEAKTRYDFLTTQTTDLTAAIHDLEHVIAELDLTIAGISSSAFKALNHDFGRFFAMLFGGGKAELKEVIAEDVDETEATSDFSEESRTNDSQTSEIREPRGKKNMQVTGIEIMASPPGKKIANIAMLSGGERALISIALISAIMVSNPSPFVVLDEVDAALDEANAQKFANIISELAHKTQFIVITHNRYTMTKANVLYGVTMRDDGASQLLSINVDEIDRLRGKTVEKEVA